ncbi:MAG: MerR family DNA-binding transcriptional regulator [Candidatus Spechtbacterales bacterium]
MKNSRKLIGKQYYTVGEAAYMLGVTPLTLRNWDKKGKLNARRNPINNYRVYKASDIELFLRKLDRSDAPRNTMDIV